MNEIKKLLEKAELRNDLITHSLFEEIGTRPFSKRQVGTILSQWFHPLHYFPTFLSRLISVTPTIDMKTVISRILWQELGEGDPNKAHETVYIDTMRDAGFDSETVAKTTPLESTKKLISGYEDSSRSYLSGLGFLYGTEVADLRMVSAIGDAVRQASQSESLPWVDIHVKQEPDHVDSANQTIGVSFTEDEKREVFANAEAMWRLWIDFFSDIEEELKE